MSKRVATTHHHRVSTRRTVSLHPWKIAVASTSLPHGVSRSKAAPRSALGGAGRAWLHSDLRSGGAYRDRTDDLMLAKQPLSQLS